MTLRPTPKPGVSPIDEALAAQEGVKHRANHLADEIFAEYESLIARAGQAFALTAMDAWRREELRQIRTAGELRLRTIEGHRGLRR